MPRKACGNFIFDKVETLSFGQPSAFVTSVANFTGGHLGLGVRLDAHGHLLRADSQPAARVHGVARERHPDVYQTFQPIPSCHFEGYTLPGPTPHFRHATGD